MFPILNNKTNYEECKKTKGRGEKISGEDRGNDYRIRFGNNRIGNTEISEICLNDNKAVNGNNYATISYYKKQNAFYVMPGDCGGTIKINNEVIEIPTPLLGDANITIGESEYKFIPMCTEIFRWIHPMERRNHHRILMVHHMRIRRI